MNFKDRTIEFESKLLDIEGSPFYLTSSSRYPDMKDGRVIVCGIGWGNPEVPHQLVGIYSDDDSPMQFFIRPSSDLSIIPGGAALKLH